MENSNEMQETRQERTEGEDAAMIMPFSNMPSFNSAWRMATAISRSTLVPEDFRGEANVSNCLIAIELGYRMHLSPMMVMQNLHVIQGRPSWSSQYLIGMINMSGKFSPLRWKIEKRGKKKVPCTVYDKRSGGAMTSTVEIDDIAAVAYATEFSSGQTLESPEVSLEMAVKEGWYTKKGSKWLTMPEIMLRYRTAAFFARTYCPEVCMGLHASDEIMDIIDVEATPVQKNAASLTERLKNMKKAPEPEVKPEVNPEPEPEPAPESKKEPESEIKPTKSDKQAQEWAERRRILKDLLGDFGMGLKPDEMDGWAQIHFGKNIDELTPDEITKADNAVRTELDKRQR